MVLKLSQLVISILSFIVLLSSCNDSEPDPTNTTNLSNQNFAVTQAQILDYGLVGTGVYNLDLVLSSKELTFSPAEQEYNGKGELLYFPLYSNTSNSLAPGVYTLKNYPGNESFKSNTVDLGSTKFGYGLNGADSSAGFLVTFKSGTVNVSKSNDGKLVLTWELLTTEGQTFKGTYDGAMTYVNALAL